MFIILLAKIFLKVFTTILSRNDMNDIVNIWLESAYKTLDFGVILLLFFALYKSYQSQSNYAKFKQI